jgi:hypothetical protein
VVTVLPRLEALIDAPPELRARIRDALLAGASDDSSAALADALRRMARWQRQIDEAGDRMRAAQAEVAALVRIVGSAGDAAQTPDPHGPIRDADLLAQALEIAWVAGGSVGDHPQGVHEGLREGLREAARKLDQSVQAVQRFRHGVQAAMVLSRPVNAEPAVRDALRLLQAIPRAEQVRKVLLDAARRSLMPAVPQGGRRELLILAAALIETAVVRDSQLAVRYAQQALAQIDARKKRQRSF